MVWAANAERTPPAQYTTTGASLSGSRPSTWNSRLPRGRCTPPGTAPCSYSSGSRTSRKIDVSSLVAASSASTSVIDALAAFNRSLGLGMGQTPTLGTVLLQVKPYQCAQHS